MGSQIVSRGKSNVSLKRGEAWSTPDDFELAFPRAESDYEEDDEGGATEDGFFYRDWRDSPSGQVLVARKVLWEILERRGRGISDLRMGPRGQRRDFVAEVAYELWGGHGVSQKTLRQILGGSTGRISTLVKRGRELAGQNPKGSIRRGD